MKAHENRNKERTYGNFTSIQEVIALIKEVEEFKDNLASYICRKRHLDAKLYANMHAEIKTLDNGDFVVSLWRRYREDPLPYDRYNSELRMRVPVRDLFVWEFSMLVEQTELAEFFADAGVKYKRIFK